MTEPIPIAGYQCPECKTIIHGENALERAKEHVQIPIDPALPDGLVFRINLFGGKVYGLIPKFTPSSSYLNARHTHVQLRAIFDYENNMLLGSDHLTSKQLKARFKSGDYELLTAAEFDELKEICNSDDISKGHLTPLVRTTPELEKILSQIPNRVQ